MTKPERIFAEDVENVESAEILVDISTRDEPIIGLQFNAASERIIVPMSLDFAEDVAKQLLSYALMYRSLHEHRKAS